MTHFRLVHAGLDVGPIVSQLDAQPELFDEFPERRLVEGTPFAEMRDIHVRYLPRDDLTPPADPRTPKDLRFYPAWYRLPALHPVVWALMSTLRAVEMGGILITRLPAGGRMLPHIDNGWHPRRFDTKAHLTLRANARCIVRVEEEEAVFRPGEIWTYPNDVEHEISNGGTTERLVVIMCLRTEP